MAYDPSIPDDVKKRLNSGVRSNALPNAMYPQPSQFDSVQAGSATNNGTMAPTPDAVATGPVRAGVIDGTVVKPASPLDANQPLPPGVRRYTSGGYTGTPGTNDVIYEGRGAHGERSFSNNQFSRDLRGGAVNPGLEALAKARGAEIGAYTDAQAAAANAAASAYATAPKTADELTSRMKAASDIEVARASLPAKGRAAAADLVGKNGENINNDPSTKVSESVREAALKSGATPEAALDRGQAAAASQFIASGGAPDDPTSAPVVRAGVTSVKRGLANILNTGRTSGLDNLPTYFKGLRSGMVQDPDAADLSGYEVTEPSPYTGRSLIGPKDKNGRRRQVLISDEDAARYAPTIEALRRRSAKAP